MKYHPDRNKDHDSTKKFIEIKEGKYFWRGIKHKISPCCIMFFENEWDSIRKNNKEYGKTMNKLTNNQGIIMCPECLTNRIFDLHSKVQ